MNELECFKKTLKCFFCSKEINNCKEYKVKGSIAFAINKGLIKVYNKNKTGWKINNKIYRLFSWIPNNYY